ncbi:hypothetical protein D3C76_1875100 [compost metagenome]
MQRVDLLLQLGLQTQTGIEGALQQGNSVFQAARGHDGAVVAAEDHTAAIATEVAHRRSRLSVQCK